MTTQPEAIALTVPGARPSVPAAGQPRPPRAGWRVVAAKEFGDGILSVRLFILLALLGPGRRRHGLLDGLLRRQQRPGRRPGVPACSWRSSPTRIRTPRCHRSPSRWRYLGPLLGIAFGFDAINGERSDRTLPRLVAQPIHRDAVIIGKFVARPGRDRASSWGRSPCSSRQSPSSGLGVTSGPRRSSGWPRGSW